MIDFYFDFLSPFAFLGWRRVRDLSSRTGTPVRPRPVLFAALLEKWGQLGPAEIPPKRAYVFRQCYRFAARHGIKMALPRVHPFVPLSALRTSLPIVAGDRQLEVVDAYFEAIWEDGIDGGSIPDLSAALTRRGLDPAILERAQEPAVKDALRAETGAAIARGVFGVPTFFVGDELFWGNDSLDDVELALAGKDPLDRAAVDAFLARPYGVVRPSKGR